MLTQYPHKFSSPDVLKWFQFDITEMSLPLSVKNQLALKASIQKQFEASMWIYLCSALHRIHIAQDDFASSSEFSRQISQSIVHATPSFYEHIALLTNWFFGLYNGKTLEIITENIFVMYISCGFSREGLEATNNAVPCFKELSERWTKPLKVAKEKETIFDLSAPNSQAKMHQVMLSETAIPDIVSVAMLTPLVGTVKKSLI